MGMSCNPRSMKIVARLGERKIIVLINIEASHNFVNKRIGEIEELKVEHTCVFGVNLGNGWLEGGIEGNLYEAAIGVQFLPDGG